MALRFGAPLLLIFLLLGLLAGEAGPGGIKFDDVGSLYVVGSIALALILFDGGLRTRLNTFRSVLAPAAALATVGVLLTAAITAPAVMFLFGFHWTEALLVGALLASTDAAAVFFLIHARGLRLRPRVGATLEVESGINDPFAILLTMILLEFLVMGDQTWQHVLLTFAKGGRSRRCCRRGGRMGHRSCAQPAFAAAGAACAFRDNGRAGDLRPRRGHACLRLPGGVSGGADCRQPAHARAQHVVVFLDAITWLAQIAMFTLLGLLAWPSRLPDTILASLVVAVVLMLVARPAAVFLSLLPFRYPNREKIFVSWVGLRGAVSVFLASIPLLVDVPNASVFFDIAFVVVVTSLLIQGWTIAPAARWLRPDIAAPQPLATPHRTRPAGPARAGTRRLSGRRQQPLSAPPLIPSWAKPTLIVRSGQVLPAVESDAVQVGDYVYLLAPPEKAEALDRFFVNMPPPAKPDMGAFGDFFVSGDVTLGSIAETYDLQIAPGDRGMTVAEDFAAHLMRPAKQGDVLPLGSIALIAHTVVDGRVTNVGLRLTDADAETPVSRWERTKLWVTQLSR